MKIKDYYYNRFRNDLSAFMPDTRIPYFGMDWAYNCGNLNKIQLESRPAFLICLYFTVLVDQAMHAHFQSDYGQFEGLTQYPKFCHGLGQFQKNPRQLLSVPIERGMVNREEIKEALPEGMELFVDEVIDFFQTHMHHISSEDFFDKLIYDSDVQIPLLIVMIKPEMKEDIVVIAYEALRNAVEKKIKKKG